MKSIVRFPSINRRILLSSLAMLPVLPASLRLTPAHAQAQHDPLPSWNDGATKAAIVDFVGRVTTQNGPYFVPPAERIATFDNDGTLWIEQPMYVQLAFVLDRVKSMAPMHPEWKDKQPFAAVLDGDLKAVAASGGCHACHSHQSCQELCPQRLNPTASIAALKRRTTWAYLKGEI